MPLAASPARETFPSALHLWRPTRARLSSRHRPSVARARILSSHNQFAAPGQGGVRLLPELRVPLDLDCCRERSALQSLAPPAEMRPSRSCCKREVLPNSLRSFSDYGCHAGGVGNSRLRHVRLAASLPARDFRQLAKNRGGAYTAVAPTATHNRTHRIRPV